MNRRGFVKAGTLITAGAAFLRFGNWQRPVGVSHTAPLHIEKSRSGVVTAISSGSFDVQFTDTDADAPKENAHFAFGDTRSLPFKLGDHVTLRGFGWET